MDSSKEMLQHQGAVIKQRLSTEIPEDLFQTVNTDKMLRLDVFLGLETEHLRDFFFSKFFKSIIYFFFCNTAISV